MKPPLERIADALEFVANLFDRSALFSPAIKSRADDRLPPGFEPARHEMPNEHERPISVELLADGRKMN